MLPLLLYDLVLLWEDLKVLFTMEPSQHDSCLTEREIEAEDVTCLRPAHELLAEVRVEPRSSDLWPYCSLLQKCPDLTCRLWEDGSSLTAAKKVHWALSGFLHPLSNCGSPGGWLSYS